MKRASSIIVAIAFSAALAGCSTMQGGGAWTTLVDGDKGLENFNPVGDANWRAEGGAIVADHKDSKPNAFLMTKEAYGDFELRAEFWVSHDANSGIYMRCADSKAPTDTTCYEANIFDERPDPSYGTGAITHFVKVPELNRTGGQWNTFDIKVKGAHIEVRLNGKQTAVFDDATKMKSGTLGLQYAQGVVKFRKLEIKPL
jgi:3-keto-disaccharide hydrolase